MKLKNVDFGDKVFIVTKNIIDGKRVLKKDHTRYEVIGKLKNKLLNGKVEKMVLLKNNHNNFQANFWHPVKLVFKNIGKAEKYIKQKKNEK